VLLTILLFTWFWLPTIAAGDASRAGGWLLACLLPALLAAPALEGGEGWFGTHAAAGSPPAISFRWDQVYGPIGSPRSNEPMLTFASGAGVAVACHLARPLRRHALHAFGDAAADEAARPASGSAGARLDPPHDDHGREPPL
jgi:hypothetical protein